MSWILNCKRSSSFSHRATPDSNSIASYGECVRSRDGVLSMEAFDDVGMVSISAPVRDSSGSVTAAACLVGTTEYMRTNGEWFEATTRKLAEQVSGRLGYVSEMMDVGD